MRSTRMTKRVHNSLARQQFRKSISPVFCNPCFGPRRCARLPVVVADSNAYREKCSRWSWTQRMFVGLSPSYLLAAVSNIV
jgi:hypothetical protein